MNKQSTVGNWTGQELHIGIDTGAKSWKVCILGTNVERTMSQPPSSEVLIAHLRKNYPGAHYHCAYEAGYFGFEYQRELSGPDIDCIVVNASDIPTNSYDRVYKTDRVDARKIARELRKGELHGIWIPSAKLLEDRSLLRARQAMVIKQTRVKNQITSLLRFYNRQIPDELSSSHWSKKFLGWLQSIEFRQPSLRRSMDMYLLELGTLRQIILGLNRDIRSLAKSDSYAENVKLLVSIPGISTLGAMSILVELGPIERFKNLDHLAGYVGLVPGTNSSGDRNRTTGITPRSKGWLRGLLVESAWSAIRHDPQLGAQFNELCQRMVKTKAIIVITRKLLSRIQHVLKSRQTYQVRPATQPE